MTDVRWLRQLSDRATPGPWEWNDWPNDSDDGAEYPGFLYPSRPLQAYWGDKRRSFPHAVLSAHGEHTQGWIACDNPADARLIALTPDLARLLADTADELEAIILVLTAADGVNIPRGESPKAHAKWRAEQALARLVRRGRVDCAVRPAREGGGGVTFAAFWLWVLALYVAVALLIWWLV